MLLLIRGEESAELLEPRKTKIGVLGLGSSIPTPPEGIQAELIVVRTFDELNEPAVSAAVRGTNNFKYVSNKNSFLIIYLNFRKNCCF